MSNGDTIECGESLILAGLVRRVAAQADRIASVTVLVDGLADQIKATSNDQNIQRLARAPRAAAPALAEAIDAEDMRPAR